MVDTLIGHFNRALLGLGKFICKHTNQTVNSYGTPFLKSAYLNWKKSCDENKGKYFLHFVLGGLGNGLPARTAGTIRARPDSSPRQRRRLPPRPRVNAFVPLKCSSRNLQFPYRENALVPLPFQKRSTQARKTLYSMFKWTESGLWIHVACHKYVALQAFRSQLMCESLPQPGPCTRTQK